MKDPEKFKEDCSEGYARVLKSRIKKKYDDMKDAIEAVDAFMVLLTPDDRALHKLRCQEIDFKYTYQEAFQKLMKKDEASCIELHLHVDAISFTDTPIEEYNLELMKVQAKVIEIIFGKDVLKKYDKLNLVSEDGRR